MPLPKESAQLGLAQIKEAILEYLSLHPEGVSNINVTDALGLHSDYEGQSKNYLSWSILGLLVNDGKVRYEIRKNRRVYFHT